jgi:hypothetical protein
MEEEIDLLEALEAELAEVVNEEKRVEDELQDSLHSLLSLESRVGVAVTVS